MRLRDNKQGVLIAPRRGKPPACPDGYERDPGDPYVFLLKLPDCVHRSYEDVKTRCCVSKVMKCKLLKATTTRLTCNTCKENKDV